MTSERVIISMTINDLPREYRKIIDSEYHSPRVYIVSETLCVIFFIDGREDTVEIFFGQ